MFLKSVDASDKVKDGQLLFQLLDEVVEEMGGANVVQVITDNVSNYVLAGKLNLQKIFSSEEWNQSQWSHKQEGKELKKKINEEIFWRKAAEIVKLAEPLVKVLRLVDGERLAMGFIYEAMDQAKEPIKRAYKDKVVKYGPIWAIIDERWNNQLHCPIHAARYFLNPRYHYKTKETRALKGEATTFSNASGTFGKNLAKIAREADEPVCNFVELTHYTPVFFATQWWEAFGSHCPELQKFAIHILSQTCSATRGEGNWSVFERIHTKRNRLDQKQLNDLVYVQYNLRLRHNQMLNKSPDSDPIVLEDIDPTSDWVVESHPAEFASDEDIDYD
eukprot:PITA_06414